MNNDVLFSEKQRFRQWWMWLSIIIINGIFLYALFYQVISGHPFGSKPMSNAELIVVSGFVFLFCGWLMSLRLDTEIRPDGIYVRFFPFHLRFRHYPWNNISKLYVRKYAPIREFGGWGLRFGIGGRGTAYNVSGDMGLQIVFSDNKKILIGTKKSAEMEAVLRKLGKWKMPD